MRFDWQPGGWWAMSRRERLLRPAGFDDLGLRRALGDRMLPLMVASMAFLAALALAGSVGAASLARHWEQGAAAALTVQVPRPGDIHGDAGSQAGSQEGRGTRLERVLSVLRDTPDIAAVRPLDERELDALLRPWLGGDAQALSLPLPSVIEVHVGAGTPDLAKLAERLRAAAPGTLIESQGIWVARLTLLARSLEACAALALLVVTGVAAAVIAVATRGGLLARRETIELVHGLGATDGYIASRFARRATRLASLGGAIGALAALPVLIVLASMAAPFVVPASPSDANDPGSSGAFVSSLPGALWAGLPALPIAAGAIGFVTAQATVRRWLRRLP